MNIIQAIKDPNLFQPFMGADLSTWEPWQGALRVLYGLTTAEHRHATIQQCTGRAAANMPDKGFDTALFLTGRRSGKSRMAAVIGAYEAVLAGHEHKFAPGERGVVPNLAPTKPQRRIVKDYLRAIFTAPLLAAEVAGETKDGFELHNGTRIEILAGDFRHVRGFTLLAAIVDEVAFFGLDEESKVRSDTELIRALKPALATVRGKLIAITSPYARRGWCYRTFTRHHGNPAGSILVWNAPSRTMNPTLPQAVVDEALAEDLQAAKSEYLGEFRNDVGEFLPRHVIEKLVIRDRTELLPANGVRYIAFCDVSGGRGDDAAVAIAHKAGRAIVVDCLRRYRPPFSPHHVIGLMAEELRRFGVRRITGDNYAAEFVCRAFQGAGIQYTRCERNKSQLYAELLPRLCSAQIELLDDEALVGQLAGLERRVRSGGRDIIDHPAGGHDDLANAVAGVADAAAHVRRAGAL